MKKLSVSAQQMRNSKQEKAQNAAVRFFARRVVSEMGVRQSDEAGWNAVDLDVFIENYGRSYYRDVEQNGWDLDRVCDDMCEMGIHPQCF